MKPNQSFEIYNTLKRLVEEDSDFLRSARQAAGLTIYDLARIIDVVPSTISKWENGRSQLFAAHEEKSLAYVQLITKLHEAQSKLFRLGQADMALSEDELSAIADAFRALCNANHKMITPTIELCGACRPRYELIERLSK